MNNITIHEPVYVGGQVTEGDYTTVTMIVLKCPLCSHTTARNGTCLLCKPNQDVDCFGCLKMGGIPVYEPPAEPPA